MENKEAKAPRRVLFPEIEPYTSGKLKVSDLHTLHYEEAGNKDGKPVICIHGGPGGGSAKHIFQFFDPKVWRVIQYDQRGCGKSEPAASLEENTTWHLVEDIEKLRKHLGIDKWVVFGGSWGSTLSLAYAQTHPEPVKALVLRGIFTLRREELIFFYQQGASFLYPDAYDAYVAPIPEVERHDLLGAYHRRLTGPDEAERMKCARAWTVWEFTTCRLHVDEESVKKIGEDDKFCLAMARIENHYFVHGGFFEKDGQLIENAHKLKHIPTTIVHGRYDVVCPVKTAWDLKKAMPHADLEIIQDAGHSAKEEGIVDALVRAVEKYKDL